MKRKDRVLLDACVLVGFPLADTLLRCAEEPAFYFPLWSDRILDEVQTALSKKLGLNPDKACRRIAAMREAFPEASVEGFEPLEPALEEIHPGDRHVLAAAIRGGAGRLLTLNTRHFPASVAARFQIEVVSPADAIREWFSQEMDLFMAKIRQQASDISKSPEEIVLCFPRFGIPQDECLAMLALFRMGRI
jgi:hypothetical protein